MHSRDEDEWILWWILHPLSPIRCPASESPSFLDTGPVLHSKLPPIHCAELLRSHLIHAAYWVVRWFEIYRQERHRRGSGKKLGPETSWNLGSMSNASNGRNLKRLQRTLGALGKEGSPLCGKNAACHQTRIWKDNFRYEWTCMFLILFNIMLKTYCNTTGTRRA